MFDDSKFIELIYADVKPEANDGLKFSGVVKINVQSLGKKEKKGTNHEHNVYLHIKLSDGYVVVGKVSPFRQLVTKDNKTDNTYNNFHPLYFRFSHTSGGFGRPRMTEFYLIYEHIRVMDDKKIKENYFLNYNGSHLKIPKRLGWINQIYGKDWHRTLIFVHRQTSPGQSVHIIGARPSNKMYSMASQDVPIYHTNVMDKSKKLIREFDDKLSWVSLKKRMGNEYKNMPLGTPLDWTTDDPCCGTSWLNSGYGFDETNSELHLGPHYWLLDIIVDSSFCETNEDSEDSDYGYQDELDDFDFDPYNSDHYTPKFKGSHSLRDKYEQLSYRKSGYANENYQNEDGRGYTFKFKICDENGNIEGSHLNGGGGLTRVAQCGMINIIEYGVPGSERYISMDGIRRPIRDY